MDNKKAVPVAMIRFLALGDSYTIGESVAVNQRWPVQLASALAAKGYQIAPPEIIATTGWRTEQLKQALVSANLTRNYGLVSLLAGVNDQYQGRSVSEYEKEFAGLLDLAVAHAGGNKKKVFVLSIPDYGYTPFGLAQQKRISEEIDLYNAANRRITEAREVTYIDITDISRQGLSAPDLVAGDGLHPSGKMYRMWVERILHLCSLSIRRQFQ